MTLLRVLHVIPSVSPRDGGPSRAIALIEHALAAAGVDVTTLTTDHDFSLMASSHDTRDTDRPAQRIYVHKWVNFYKVAPSAITYLLRTVKRYDLVHIHALFSFTSTIAAWTARAARVPYVVRPLGTLSSYGLGVRRRRLKKLSMKLIENGILRHAAAVHFTSQAELDEARALGIEFRGVVIPLGINPEELPSSVDLRSLYPELIGRQGVLFLSRLDPKKNIEGLIDAIAASDKLKRNCTLLIAGAGEASYVASLKARAADAGVSGHIIWLGHVTGAQKNAAFAAADVFVLPSISENFGIAAVEALLAGLPAVLGQGVAIAREVYEAGAGLVVSPSSNDIAQALERLLTDEQSRQQMGRRARAFAEREYSINSFARRLIELYEDLRTAHRTAAQ